MDEGEVEFLQSVDQFKKNQEKEKKKEEKDLIEQQRKAFLAEKATTSTVPIVTKVAAGSL